ncbi:hypothetical protein MACJ_002791 [Theileria orientalis]|uniref:Bystin n=1 Tax=Theileria orientalis TaxID=68886 RepID=A0A976M6Q9_THEOR|nr:hypothetical protein MACJ_002791 [Theileria orientalis]
MKKKVVDKKAKNAKVIKNDKNAKRKKKNKINDLDSDLSDFEAEFVEELPKDVSFKVNKLIREANEEISVPRVSGLDFLEKDPYVDFDLPVDSSGFLPESTVDTSTIWSKLNNIKLTQVTKEDVLAKIRPVYKEIGVYLSKYRSGGLPKAFKVLPKMSNWLEMVQLTNPSTWSPNAMYEVTKLFSSNMNEANAETFYSCILLPAIRQDLSKSKTLNHHYYEALIKAIFKPTAWFKGLLLPLVEEGCTYREAAIIGSVLRKVSIPVLHVSAFIIQMCKSQKWFGSTSFIMTIFFQKKFRLPIKVIKECLMHFYKFIHFHDALPVIWHQSLYVFLYNYKHMLNEEDHKLLRELLSKHRHPEIGATIDKLLSCRIEDVIME